MGVIELYDALMAAGAPESKARAAVGALPLGEEIARRDDIARVETGLARVEAGLDARVRAVEDRLTVMVTVPEFDRGLRQLKEQIDQARWKSTAIQIVVTVVLVALVFRLFA